MEVEADSSKSTSKHASRSLKNEHGNFPVWMSQRKIKQQKQKTKVKSAEGKVNKRKKKKFL